ncbi:MAG: pirin family protein [Bacteroidia bacterium]|nr:pirin family protein [Bacteroidia bacterium]MCZ2277460.1 pirin family protein [Bacteroidia bacterium]
MTKFVFHPANSRGHVSHGWLNAYHSFSFASWQNPERVHFGKLRVLNDDTIEAGKGFGTHPHDNMEIITIPLSGSLEHKDSLLNGAVIRSGEVQVMSAGKGILHSEFNSSASGPVNLFQIWIFPKIKNVQPRYGKAAFDVNDRRNKFQLLVQPGPVDSGLWIYQDAFLSMGNFEKNFLGTYSVHKAGNGVYMMVVKGVFEINGELLSQKDALGVWNTHNIQFLSKADNSELLMIEVPMN